MAVTFTIIFKGRMQILSFAISFLLSCGLVMSPKEHFSEHNNTAVDKSLLPGSH